MQRKEVMNGLPQKRTPTVKSRVGVVAPPPSHTLSSSHVPSSPHFSLKECWSWMPLSSPQEVKVGTIQRSSTNRPPMLTARMGALSWSYHGAVLLEGLGHRVVFGGGGVFDMPQLLNHRKDKASSRGTSGGGGSGTGKRGGALKAGMDSDPGGARFVVGVGSGGGCAWPAMEPERRRLPLFGCHCCCIHIKNGPISAKYLLTTVRLVKI